MDNFGVFKLISSLYSFMQKNNNQNLNENLPEKSTPKTLNKENSASPFPIQKNMILTMTNHDEFVKRVLKNNKNKE